MKREIAFILLAIIFGVVLGLATMAVLAAIAVPSYRGILLTLTEKAEYEQIYQIFHWVTEKSGINILMVIVLAMAMVVLGLFIINLNPNIRNAFRSKKGILKAVVVLLVNLSFFLILFSPLMKFIDMPFIQPITFTVFGFFFFFFTTGALWFIAGETGWAGDFSSWKMGVQDKRPEPIMSFIRGGIVGICMYGLWLLNSWAFEKYFPLVSEVLDKSGEVSFLGFKLMGYAIMFLFGTSLAIFAGMTVSLSPRYLTLRQRLLRLIFPAIVFTIMISVVTGIHQDAVAKYDMGKKNLAEALGVPETASESKTIILFKPEKVISQEWPMQAVGRSFISNNSIQLSYENLKKVEDYTAQHKDGSVFRYAAMDVLVNGYYALWDIEKGIERQFQTSEEILLHRLMLISKLRHIPVTPENLRYLKAYTDESKWYAGGNSALKIAEGLAHFGLTDEAREWLKKAGERGADIANATFLQETVLKNGKVLGRIMVNGRPVKNIKVALIKYSEYLDKIEDTTLPHRLLDVRTLDNAGRFVFDNLGSGDYMLAIMTDKETISYDIPAERLRVDNPPGMIKCSGDTASRNLGDINIVFKEVYDPRVYDPS